jgi:Ca2+-binding EF-hand superfamily protein
MSSNKLNRFLGLTLGVAGLTGLAVPRVALANDTEKEFQEADTNGDGVLTADEHAAAARTMFDKMDTDHDGYLTKAELKAGHEQYMHKASTTSSSSK